MAGVLLVLWLLTLSWFKKRKEEMIQDAGMWEVSEDDHGNILIGGDQGHRVLLKNIYEFENITGKQEIEF